MTAASVARDALGRLAPAARRTFDRLTPGAGRSLLGYGAFTVALFAVCLLATFPHEIVLRSALQRVATGPLAVDTTGVTLGWRLGYAVREVRLVARDRRPPTPVLAARDVRVDPSLLGLLRGTPFPLSVHASLYGGSLAGSLDPRPASFALSATLRDLDLAREPDLAALLEGTVRGRLNGSAALATDGRRPGIATGTLALDAADLALEGVRASGITVPDLHFTQVRLAGTVKSGRLEITELMGDGVELTLQGTGNVLVQPLLGTSVLNLELTLGTPAGAPDGLRRLLQLIPGAAGEGGTRIVRVGGTLARPRLQP